MNKKDNILDNQVVRATYQDRSHRHVKVFNLQTFGPDLHVKLDLSIHKNCTITRIYDTETSYDVKDYKYNPFGPSWVDIPITELNSRTGMHEYCIELLDRIHDSYLYQYFTYSIQNDHPEKPYLYIDREEKISYPVLKDDEIRILIGETKSINLSKQLEESGYDIQKDDSLFFRILSCDYECVIFYSKPLIDNDIVVTESEINSLPVKPAIYRYDIQVVHGNGDNEIIFGPKPFSVYDKIEEEK